MKSPTAAEKRHMAKVAALGCIACRLDGTPDTPAEIHHVRGYGKRDHGKCIGLCPGHHRPTAAIPGVPSRHGNPKEFSERYGDDHALLIVCLGLINGVLK